MRVLMELGIVIEYFVVFRVSVVCVTGRRFPRNSVLHEEYQLASVGASSLSRVVGTAHHSDTSNICHEGHTPLSLSRV